MNERPKFLRVLAGEALTPPPLWIMRQAGRYLPEYRATRKTTDSFLELCFTPELAADVTLQPVRRFGFDAAILFSDILVVPHALGQGVRFEEGRGPVLDPLPENLDRLDAEAAKSTLAPVSETVRLVRRELAADKALIGFCGAPWTVATYMVGGGGSPDQGAARRLGLEDPERLQELIDILVDASVGYLIAQIEAGADVVKVFDSWAGILDAEGFERWVIRPMQMIVEKVRAASPETPIIGFPRGGGARLGDYARVTKVDAVAVDWTVPMRRARELVSEPTALQGNLDPLRLIVGGRALDEGVDAILAAMRGRAHVFNLGHGITPDAPLAHVERLVERVRREDILMLWVKSLHVISVIAWMAALLYLPRLMVYHAESAAGSDKSETFKVMERRLLRGIAMPAMIATWIFGVWTATLIGAWGEGWLHAKLACVVLLTAYQVVLIGWVRAFAEDRNRRSVRFYRIANELPTLFLIAIVILVIVKPF